MATLSIYRSSVVNVTVEIDDKTTYTHKLMGDHNIVSSFVSTTVLDIAIGDYITWGGENFYINRLPQIKKINEHTYQYDITFESVLYNLSKKLLISIDGLAEYYLVGTAADFIESIVANMSELEDGWTVGTVDDTDELNISFVNESCRAALQKVAEAFKLEYEITTKSISLTKSAGSNTSLSFEYGKNNGLYNLERQQINDQNIVTKVYGFGGIKNIPYGYRDRAKRLIFEERFLTKNVNLYGTIEGQYTNEDIYPKRTGTLSAVHMEYIAGVFDPISSYIEDSSIDFDLNNYLISGSVATIVFKSGDLSGTEFEIWKFDNTNHRFYINPFSDEDGYKTPNSLNEPVVGDTYTLVNISMPQSYIDDAEEKLETATQTFLDENSIPMVVYSVEIDPKHARTNGISIKAGDRVTVTDSPMSINDLIRVAEVSYPLVNQYQISAVIADFVPYTLQERIINTVITQKKETVVVDRTTNELERRNSMRQSQLKELIFDTDGYFNGERINPLTIETMLLAVGSPSGNFSLNGITIKPNYLGDANRIYIGTGQLYHRTYNVSGVYNWVIGSAIDQGSLTPSSAYYVYARCSKTALTGNWVISTSQLTVDSEAGYYHLLIGILYTVVDSWRDFDFTYGMTYINGRIITTGRIRSLSGTNYFDLDQNQFRIGDSTNGLDWNVTASGVLTIKGALVQNGGGITSMIGCFRGAYNASYTYYIGDEATDAGSTWRWKSGTPASGHTPAEDAYWTCIAAAGGGSTPGATGNPGDYIEYQYAKNGSSVTPPSLINTDLNPTGWSTTPPSIGALEYLWVTRGRKDYLGTSLVGTWSTPVRITGVGENGSAGPTGVYQGVYDAGKTYYGTTVRADIVYYGSLYYIARTDAGNGFSGHLPTDTNYWNPFGANFESVATSLLFATLAYIENMGVRYFEGIPVGAGDLSGTLATAPPDKIANVASTPQRDLITKSGYPGGGSVTINGHTHAVTWNVTATQTINDFINSSPYFGAGVTLQNNYNGSFYAEGYFNMGTPSFYGTGNSASTAQAFSSGTAQVETITLTGTSGAVEIRVPGYYGLESCYLFFNNSLDQTAQDFIDQNTFLGGTLSISGAKIIFTASIGGIGFTAPTIANYPNTGAGAISIQGNDIFESHENSDYGTLNINMKGYGGGQGKYRRINIGDGKGHAILTIWADSNGSRVEVQSSRVSLRGLVGSGSGLQSGDLYRDSGFVKIV